MEPLSSLSQFSTEEQTRYSRHFVLPEVGVAGQLKLKNSKVLIVGLGGLGSPAALYLASSGIGTLGLVDFDQVDLSNLQRQVLFRTEDQDHSKAARAAARLLNLNPNTEFRVFPEELTEDSAERLVAPFDLVIDGTDNSRARLAINDACLRLKKPWIYGSVHRYEGQFSLFAPGLGPCYRCLFPDLSSSSQSHAATELPSCAQTGVLGVLPGLIGTLQATEALKLILGLGECTPGTLVHVDGLELKLEKFNFQIRPDCLCQTLEQTKKETQSGDEPYRDLDPEEFLKWNSLGKEFLLLDVRTRPEFDQYNIGGQLVPLDELESWLDGLGAANPLLPVVVICAAGVRSAYAAELLAEKGFPLVWNLTGGLKRLQKHL